MTRDPRGRVKAQGGGRVYLSLAGEAVGADDAFIVLDRGLGVARLVLVPEVHVEEPKPLSVSFIPLKVVQQRPGCVALHVHPIPDCCDEDRGGEPDARVAAKYEDRVLVMLFHL